MEGEKKTFKPTPSFRNELMHRRRRHHHPFRSIMQKSNQQFIYGWGRVERMGENDYRTRRERVWILLGSFEKFFFRSLGRWGMIEQFWEVHRRKIGRKFTWLDNCRRLLFKELGNLEFFYELSTPSNLIYFWGGGRMRNRWINDE